MSRIFVTGDLHGEIDIKKLGSKSWPLGRQELTKEDYLIITGDFGLVWDDSPQCNWWLNWLHECPWTTLFVDGNHENFDLLEQYPVEEMFGGQVARINDSVFWLKRGEVFVINEQRIFVFGGGMSHDQDWRTPGKTWWPQEQSKQCDFDNAIKNLEKYNWCVDFVLSHVPPYCEVLGFMPRAYALKGYGTDWTEHHLDELKSRLSFERWYFGHLHMDQTEGRFTCIYYKIVELGRH